MTSLYASYRKVKLGEGGAVPDSTDAMMGVIGKGAGTLASVIDAAAEPNEYGHQSGFATTASSTLKYGALGASVAGPVGAAVGGAYGLVSGLVTSGANARKDQAMTATRRLNDLRRLTDTSQQRAAADPTLYQGYKSASYYGDGGPGLFSNNRKKFVDSTLKANAGLDWVQRLFEKNTPTLQIPGQSAPSTHFMADDGNGYVYPTVVRESGNLKYLGDKAQEYARNTSTGIQFPKEQGTWFANNGYKLGTGVLNGLGDGGPITDSTSIPKPLVKPVTPKLDMAEELAAYNAGKRGYTPVQRDSVATSFNRNAYTTHLDSIDTKVVLPVKKRMTDGGRMSSPLMHHYMEGGKARELSSSTVEIKGRPHTEGGVNVPDLGVQLEGGETVKDDFVYSSRLGFAAQHKPIAKAIGKIEQKPVTGERIAAIKRLNEREDKLGMAQEYFKNIQQQLQTA